MSLDLVNAQTYYLWRKEYGGLKTVRRGAAGGAQAQEDDVLAALAKLFVTRGPPADKRGNRRRIESLRENFFGDRATQALIAVFEGIDRFEPKMRDAGPRECACG